MKFLPSTRLREWQGINLNLRKLYDLWQLLIITCYSRKSSESLKQLDSPDHKAALEQLYTYMSIEKNNYTNNSVRSDDNLSIYSQVLGK